MQEIALKCYCIQTWIHPVTWIHSFIQSGWNLKVCHQAGKFALCACKLTCPNHEFCRNFKVSVARTIGSNIRLFVHWQLYNLHKNHIACTTLQTLLVCVIKILNHKDFDIKQHTSNSSLHFVLVNQICLLYVNTSSVCIKCLCLSEGKLWISFNHETTSVKWNEVDLVCFPALFQFCNKYRTGQLAKVLRLQLITIH